MNYNNIKSVSYKLLLSCNISSLPVDLKSVLKSLRAAVFTLNQVRPFLTAKQFEFISKLFEKCDAVTLYDKEKNSYIIIYTSKNTLSLRSRWTVAHEIGHIALNHIKFNAGNKNDENFNILKTNTKLEREADAFASSLLCPLAVLDALDVNSYQQIRELCGVSLTASKVTLGKLKKWKEAGSFEPADIEILNRFRSFTEKYLHEKK